MSEVLQTQFKKFHEKIKLIDTNENKLLREKRDMLVLEIKTYLQKKSEKEEAPLITFSYTNQGSYSMGTGIQPLSKEDDYDIDVALLFNISNNDFTPLEVKKWVFDALDKSPRTVQYKKPCVRVQYNKEGEVKYHVDFACYADLNDDSLTYLSKGKPTSQVADKFWEIAEPLELKNKINDRFKDSDEKQQFKRVIRYLKRWKDYKFKNTVDGKPTGIAITALAYYGFTPVNITDSFTSTKTENDLEATLKLVQYILGQFDIISNEITVKLPVPPGNDLFKKMKINKNQLLKFKENLEALKQVLISAKEEPDPVEACKNLSKHFGDDFPIPDKESTGQKRNIAVVGSIEQS